MHTPPGTSRIHLSELLLNEPPIIDHNPNEPPVDRGPGPWRVVVPVVVVLWIGYLWYMPFDWASIALGLGTGIVLTAWVIEITGNKAPDSWRNKSGSAASPATSNRRNDHRA